MKSAKTPSSKRTTLKDLARHVGLSTTTISVVLNRSPVADSIPQETKDRIFAAAEELNYRPSYFARSLRKQRSHSVGVLVPEISEGYAAGVMSGVEGYLIQQDYVYLMASHRSKPALVDKWSSVLEDRSVEGFIMVAAQLKQAPRLPTVAVAGHKKLEGVTNVVIDHEEAVRLALTHLAEQGHRRIAFFRGQAYSADTEDRWRAIQAIAGELGIEVPEELTIELIGDPAGELFSAEQGYKEGYDFGRRLLDVGRKKSGNCKPDFTALFAFNDISAIGAMRAFLDDGLSVPGDISVVGFDDIQSAGFHNPSLTTVRQPLKEMGATAGRLLLERLAGENPPDFVTVEPELIVRASTGAARTT